jgi:hypothetical protein
MGKIMKLLIFVAEVNHEQVSKWSKDVEKGWW